MSMLRVFGPSRAILPKGDAKATASAGAALSTTINIQGAAVAQATAGAPLTTGKNVSANAGAVAAASGTILGGSDPAGADITTISFEGTGTQYVTFGHVFAQGEVPSGTAGVITNNANAPVSSQQCNVMATWPDGSARHAVITAQVAGGSSYKVRSGSPASGSNRTVSDLLAAIAGNIATVTLTGAITGTAVLRDLLESATNRAAGGLQTLQSGPAMLSVAVAQNFSTHVRVTFHVRWYGGSLIWVDFIFENGYGNVALQADKSYTASLNLNGTAVYSGAVTHYNHAMWHKAAWSSGGTLYTKHNVAHLRDSVKAVPYYDPTVAPSGTFLNTLPSTLPAPMAKTSFWAIPPDIEEPGYGDHIGIMPRWDALYVKSDGDSRAFNAMLTGHDSCMVYPMGFMSSADGEHMRVSDFTTASFSLGSGFGSGYATTSNPNGAFRTGWAASHSPSAGFLPYLLTGNYVYLREMTAWASEHAIWGSTSRNTTYLGMTVRGFPQVQQRGWGWTYRTVAQCAWALPNAHASKLYFNNTVLRNFELDTTDYVSPGTQASNRGGGVLGFLYQYDWEGGGGNYSGFMHAFLCQAVSYCVLDLGFSTGLSFAQYTGKFIAGLMGNTGEFPFEFAAKYSWLAGPASNQWYATWATFKANVSNLRSAAQSLDSGTTAIATQAAIDGPNHTSLRNEIVGDMGSATYYFANYQAAISYLERLEIPGGWACWYRTQLSGRKPDYSQIPQFGIDKRPLPMPTWVTALPLNQWYQIPGTALSSVAPSPVPAGNTGPQSKVVAWGGMAVRTLYSEIKMNGGGHFDYAGNELNTVRLRTETPGWVQSIASSSVTAQDVSRYADGRPTSRHQYYNQQFIDGLDWHLMHGATFCWGNGASFDTADAYNNVTGAWLNRGNSVDSSGVKAIAKNWANEYIYFMSMFSSSALLRYRPYDGNQTTVATSSDYGDSERACAIDPKRGRMLITQGVDNQGWHWRSIDNGARTNVSPAGVNQASAALEYDPDGDRYLFYSSGQNIQAINPTTFAVTTITMSGGTPAAAQNGVYNKFRYVPELKGVALVNSYTGNVYFARLNA